MDHKIDKIVEDINEIKLDLREHMSRTNQNEVMIEKLVEEFSPVRAAYIGVKWSITALMIAASIITAFYKFKP